MTLKIQLIYKLRISVRYSQALTQGNFSGRYNINKKALVINQRKYIIKY